VTWRRSSLGTGRSRTSPSRPATKKLSQYLAGRA
jgi:hypothetical protein